MKILKIDGSVTVITNTGDVITASNVSEETFKKVYAYVQENNVEAIKQLLVPELCNEEKKFIAKKQAVENIHTMAQHLTHLFEIKNDALYRIGIELSVPEELALKYVEVYTEWLDYYEVSDDDSDPLESTTEFQAVDRFWMWCSLNPNAESREDLFRFLQHHEMQITNQGMFLAYRRVVTTGTSNIGLVNFVSNNYVKVKSKWKKNPKDFIVYEKDGMLELSSNTKDSSYTNKGTLEQLYLDLPNLQTSQFTDAHTKTMDYRIGVEARIERHQGNQSNQVSCSKGLHVASKAYDYSGFGDTAILVAVNPMDVLAVPRGEDGKLRTCAFTPVAVLEQDEENNILADDDMEVEDLLFAHYEEQVAKLEEMISNNSAYELNINHILNAPSHYMLSNILSNLQSAEEIINSRTSYI
jgi:hypothetical protein